MFSHKIVAFGGLGFSMRFSLHSQLFVTCHNEVFNTCTKQRVIIQINSAHAMKKLPKGISSQNKPCLKHLIDSGRMECEGLLKTEHL